MSRGRALPGGFLIGCATAAHQVEGGIDNDWSRWVAADRSVVKDGSDATLAIDHFSRFREDLADRGAMGHSAHRFSVEWARVEPQPGVFDPEALRHYRGVVTACRAAGMEPYVTLQHFTLPVWLAERGGLTAPETPWLFARYAGACAEALGDAVRFWLTINEPAVLAAMGHLLGNWPPRQASPASFLGALRGLLLMHAAGSTAIHTVAAGHGWDAAVSLAHHERPLLPATGHLIDRAAAALPNWLFNRWFLEACVSGRVLPPVGAGELVPGLSGSLDYLGVNNYAHDSVHFDPRARRTLFARIDADPSLPHSSFGWAIDAQGFRKVLVDLWQRYRLPIHVTENGVADTGDELRPRFIIDHLNALLDAVDEGCDIRAYLHWTAWDNFEWDQGYTQHFGLIAVDRDTMQRTPKPSAELYARICRTGVVPRDV
ncbi:MAG: glycoside hydrolase family 1 protein [Candidatus Dormibacteraeota bacterium]|nr:glycoside hydrolase family 1 protein [Candidatus Dormibacteraeota bacterium]